jgi:probable F420-dependent oxidoreductase
VSLATCAAVTERIGLSTAVCLPVESDPITLAKTIATLDHLSGGRVTIGAGFGWNTDELTDHHVSAAKRRTVLKEYLEAMRALWTEEEASYDGEFVTFGPSWAYPKPPQGRVPVIIGAGAGPRTFEWIARNADGWMTTPTSTDVAGSADALRKAWADAGREGQPDVRILVAKRPTPEDLADWSASGASELIWGVPDADKDKVLGYLDKMAGRLGLTA